MKPRARWKRNPRGFWWHPAVLGCIMRRRGCLVAEPHDASTRIRWDDDDAAPGWIYVDGLEGWGVFRALGEAQRWALRQRGERR